ncbi:MAG: asparagine synthase-related protein, partial [Actinomycetota bacterium]|nr:asparagine synthase-related protein [Actinomycetota bacterium]
MGALRSRGPDGRGWELIDQRKVFFGHTRLAIFDLSDSGSQPMTSYDRRWIISFNGEIYNYRELSRYLARKCKDDSWLQTRSDTRILLECIAFFGLAWTLARIDGMAAFSLWDKKKRELHLFRDFCGEKPLFVVHNPDKVFFTSDLKAFPPEIWDSQVDAQALRWYLSFGYCHSERSIFTGIKQVKPGHLLSFRNEADQWNCLDDLLVQRPLVEPTVSSQFSYPEKVQFLADAIETSVAQQCKADVPIGIFLSGGIDSSLVSALASDYLPSVSAYTISMRGHGDLDETLAASRIAQQFGLDHTIIDIADFDFQCLVEDFIRELGQP